MKYAVFTFDGYGLPIAMRLAQEGEEVWVGVVPDMEDTLLPLEVGLGPEDSEQKARRLSLHEGIAKKADACALIERIKKKPEDWFVFCDLNHLYRFAGQLRDLPLRGNFPTEQDYLFEIDREAAKDFVLCEYPGVQVGEKKRFDTLAQAKRFLSGNEEMWVLKGLAEDARTIVPDVEDVDLAHGQVLDALAQSPEEYESAGFLLELLIPNALELTPQRIYVDGERLATCLCIENKPIGCGNVGPMTDCSMDVVFATEDDEKINQIAFPPIVDEMAARSKGIFYWDASLLADPRTGKLYFGEFCSNRPGYNCLYSEMELAGGAAKYFEALANGKNPYQANSIAASVRLFNLHRDEESRPRANMTIDFKERVQQGLWLLDAKQERGRLKSVGNKDTIGVMTASGRSLTEAARKLYRHVDEFSFEGAYYRPKFDLVTREYRTSIPNRIDFGLQRGLFKIGFGL